MLVAIVPERGRRSGLDESSAADAVWALASPETYDLLVSHLGYDAARYERWLRDLLRAALTGCTDAPEPQGRT